jgi:hypothetical protein
MTWSVANQPSISEGPTDQKCVQPLQFTHAHTRLWAFCAHPTFPGFINSAYAKISTYPSNPQFVLGCLTRCRSDHVRFLSVFSKPTNGPPCSALKSHSKLHLVRPPPILWASTQCRSGLVRFLSVFKQANGPLYSALKSQTKLHLSNIDVTTRHQYSAAEQLKCRVMLECTTVAQTNRPTEKPPQLSTLRHQP